MKLELWTSEDRSGIVCGDVMIDYCSPAHKFFSESDYASIRSELLTYGEKAALVLAKYFESKQKQKMEV